jgi:hypothetical protein
MKTLLQFMSLMGIAMVIGFFLNILPVLILGVPSDKWFIAVSGISLGIFANQINNKLWKIAKKKEAKQDE